MIMNLTLPKTFKNYVRFERGFWQRQSRSIATVPKTSVFGGGLLPTFRVNRLKTTDRPFREERGYRSIARTIPQEGGWGIWGGFR
jgi:hypothetical protein